MRFWHARREHERSRRARRVAHIERAFVAGICVGAFVFLAVHVVIALLH
jgi:hypothetical protein